MLTLVSYRFQTQKLTVKLTNNINWQLETNLFKRNLVLPFHVPMSCPHTERFHESVLILSSLFWVSPGKERIRRTWEVNADCWSMFWLVIDQTKPNHGPIQSHFVNIWKWSVGYQGAIWGLWNFACSQELICRQWSHLLIQPNTFTYFIKGKSLKSTISLQHLTMFFFPISIPTRT